MRLQTDNQTEFKGSVFYVKIMNLGQPYANYEGRITKEEGRRRKDEGGRTNYEGGRMND